MRNNGTRKGCKWCSVSKKINSTGLNSKKKKKPQKIKQLKESFLKLLIGFPTKIG